MRNVFFRQPVLAWHPYFPQWVLCKLSGNRHDNIFVWTHPGCVIMTRLFRVLPLISVTLRAEATWLTVGCVTCHIGWALSLTDFTVIPTKNAQLLQKSFIIRQTRCINTATTFELKWDQYTFLSDLDKV